MADSNGNGRRVLYLALWLISIGATIIGTSFWYSDLSPQAVGHRAPEPENPTSTVLRVDEDGTPHGTVYVKRAVSTLMDGRTRYSPQTINLPARGPTRPTSYVPFDEDRPLYKIEYQLLPYPDYEGGCMGIWYMVYKIDSNKYVVTVGAVPLCEFYASDEAAALETGKNLSEICVATCVTEEIEDGLKRDDNDAFNYLGINPEFVFPDTGIARPKGVSAVAPQDEANSGSDTEAAEEAPKEPRSVIAESSLTEGASYEYNTRPTR